MAADRTLDDRLSDEVRSDEGRTAAGVEGSDLSCEAAQGTCVEAEN